MNNQPLIDASLVKPGDIVLKTTGAGDQLDPRPLVILINNRQAAAGDAPTKIVPGTRFSLVYPRSAEAREEDLRMSLQAIEMASATIGQVMQGLSKSANEAMSTWDRHKFAEALSEVVGDCVIMSKAHATRETLSEKSLSEMEPGDVTITEFAGQVVKWVAIPSTGRGDPRFQTVEMMALNGPEKGQARRFLIPGDELEVEVTELSVGDVVRVESNAVGCVWEVIENPDTSSMDMSGTARERLNAIRTIRCIFDNAESQANAITKNTNTEEGPGAASKLVSSSRVGEVRTLRPLGVTITRLYSAEA